MKGKHGRQAALRRQHQGREQERQDRLAAAAVADNIEAARTEEESVAALANLLAQQMSAHEVADSDEVCRLAQETSDLLLEAARIEGTVDAADLRFKRWYAVVEEEIILSTCQNAKPKLLPSSGTRWGICTTAGMKAVEAWRGLKTHKADRGFRERKWAGRRHATGWFDEETAASGSTRRR